MTKVILACDESGAKGYADKDEAEDGETGVFAGIMVPEEIIAEVEADFRAIFDRFKPSTGKLHIADLQPAEQQALRQDVYGAIEKHTLPCFWYALHVAGLHRFHVDQAAALAEAKASAEANSREPGRYKGGSPRENPISMHVALFQGLYSRLVAFLEERGKHDVEIEVRTDRVDNPIVTQFEEVAKELLTEIDREHVAKRFDTVENKIVEGKIRVTVQLPPDYDLDIKVKSLTLFAVDNNDGLVLAADVLSNHINYIFKNRDSAEKYKPLNSPDAIEAHPLRDHLDAFLNWGSGDFVADGMFRHPKRQDPPTV